MNDLEKFFVHNTGRLVSKWSHYFDVYERHFSRFRGQDIVLVEIGVWHGGSLQMWREYFGQQARIIGIDINPRTKQLEQDGVEIFVGSQSDPHFLQSLRSQIPKIDILIDDGGHMMRQQRIAFDMLFRHVQNNGVYLVEDLHTSYWLKFGGGHNRLGTFIEYSKSLIDRINAHHSEERSLKPDELTKTIASLHFYDSIVVIEKGVKEIRPSNSLTSGCLKLLDHPDAKPQSTLRRRLTRVAGIFLHWVNAVLRFLRLPGWIWR